MSQDTDIRVPVELERRIFHYRDHVWKTKIVESVCLALSAVFAAFLFVFVADRFFDTPSWLRLASLFAAAIGAAMLPLGIYRWVWRRRTFEQLARLISRRLPNPGDRLLGVLELVNNREEQSRSPTLCRAAINQVAVEANQWDLLRAAPDSRRAWRWQAIGLATAVAMLAVLVPQATSNALIRFLSPWGITPRYTFAALCPIPAEMIVPHGETVQLDLPLAKESRWRPAIAKVEVVGQTQIDSKLADDGYHFEIPSQIDTANLIIRVGDARHNVELRPTLRPELTSVLAHATLPEYLQRPAEIQRDVRGGSLSLVTGSKTTLVASANRELKAAFVNDIAAIPHETEFRSQETTVDTTKTVEFRWQDQFGLTGVRPFEVVITRADDESPSVSCQGLSRQNVVLVSEQIRFDVQVSDDFGIHKIGMQWNGFTDDDSPPNTQGQRILAAGGPEVQVVNTTGTFMAEALGIEPQPIELRIFAEDYLPERGRVYSPAYVIYVLSPDEHAIWITEQLSRWHRKSLEVRDRELQLYETNKQLRELAADELDSESARRDVERQARAESANGRHLGDLTRVGEQLVKDASRNPEFGVGHLEKWAEMLQILKDISANRMPSVSDLLQDAASAPKLASDSQSAPTAGQVKRSGGSGGSTDNADDVKKPTVPQLVDAESTQQPLDDSGDESTPTKPAGGGKFTLPVTTLVGKPKTDEVCAAEQSVDAAVEEQRDLLVEFERVADELNQVLANLEGSTLVKRLKAASREQYRIAGGLGDLLEVAFGLDAPATDQGAPGIVQLKDQEERSGQIVSYIMDDMQAYFERRRLVNFRAVLEEMKSSDIVGNLRRLGDELLDDQGISMSHCEYWSDTLDRWAEDLVDTAAGGT